MINQSYLYGLIEGCKQMFIKHDTIDPLVGETWTISENNKKYTLTCEYSYYCVDRLICAGTYDTPPQWDEIDERTTASITFDSNVDTAWLVNEIQEIFYKLSNLKLNEQ